MALLASFLTSCQSITTPEIPFDLGVRYEIEEGFFIVATPGAKGGLDVSLEGEGELGEYVVVTPEGWVITSPNTGIVYRVTRQDNGRPLIEVISGNGGRFQLTDPDGNVLGPEKPASEVELIPPRTNV